MEPHREQSDANKSPVWEGQGGPETPVFVWLHPAETIDTVDDYTSYISYQLRTAEGGSTVP
jgi:hypothetical protein